MSRQSCRDCKRCTESTMKKALTGGSRLVTKPLASPVRAFKKKCRRCGHPISWHKQIDGRFKD